MNTLFISNFLNDNDPSRIYRCHNAAKQIINSGGNATTIDQYNLINKHELIKFADLVVFQRVHYTPDVDFALKTARESGVAVAVDYDDLIFLPWKIKQQGAIRSGVITDIEGAERMAHMRMQILPWIDAAITSTPAIAEEFEQLGIPAFISKNAIDDELEKSVVKKKVSSLKKLLYMSGSQTHGADFSLIHAPLTRFMQEHKDVMLTLLGSVDAPNNLIELPNVEVIGKLSMNELLPFVSNFDLSLVPLEDTCFNHCKSSLKFFESGFVSVPVIASPRREFVSDIKHGVNGFLAETQQEWYDTLISCYRDKQLLKRVTHAAHSDIIKNYTLINRRDTYLDLAKKICSLRYSAPKNIRNSR